MPCGSTKKTQRKTQVYHNIILDNDFQKVECMYVHVCCGSIAETVTVIHQNGPWFQGSSHRAADEFLVERWRWRWSMVSASRYSSRCSVAVVVMMVITVLIFCVRTCTAFRTSHRINQITIQPNRNETIATIDNNINTQHRPQQLYL
jgi:hypothetical protein